MKAKFSFGPVTRSLGLLLAMGGLLAGCRGQKSSNPPIHPNLNMDFQYNYQTQEGSEFFEDGRSMRPEIPGVVARGEQTLNVGRETGKESDVYLAEVPLPLTRDLLNRGQERYGIYCVPCHGGAGYGDGLVIKRGMLPPPSFHDDRLLAMPSGQIYEAIAKGVRGNMPAYDNKLSVADRWAVVAYVRALQVSQNADLSSVPEDVARSKGWK